MNTRLSFLMRTITTGAFTLGKLYAQRPNQPDEFLYYTIECQWLDNKPFISCVPAGNYNIIPTISPKFGEAYYLQSIEDKTVDLIGAERTHCLFHKANKASELHGCIAIAETLGVLDNELAALNSGHAISDFLNMLGAFEYRLIIERF